ncbi:MAG: hypothetical protein WBA68_10285 [Alteraurantiacibacter sp.]
MSMPGEVQLVSMIAMAGWLILALSAYRAHRVDASKTVRMALIWGAVFAGVALLFTLIQ